MQSKSTPGRAWRLAACLAALALSDRHSVLAALPAPQDPEPPAPAANRIGGLAQAPWPKFGGGAQNRGAGGGKTPGQARPWTFAMVGRGANSAVGPVALGANGTVFVTGDYLRVLDGATGKLKWSLPSVSTNISGVVLAADNTLYICGAVGATPNIKHKVFALDADTGKARWAFQLPRSATNTPALGANGALYVQCSNGVLYALDSATGKQRWAYALQEPIFTSQEAFHTVLPVVMCSPTVGPDGTVYTCYDRLYAIDGATGQEKWKYSPEGGSLGISPAIGPDGVLYIGMRKQNQAMIAAIDGRTGNQLWTFSTQGRTLYCPPCLDTDGTLYAGCEDGNLYALNAQSGALKWQFPTKGAYMTCPATDAEHEVYVGSGDGHFYALDGGTGAPKWAAPLNDAPIFAALGTNGLVYVVTRSGLVCALRASDGARGKSHSFPQ